MISQAQSAEKLMDISPAGLLNQTLTFIYTIAHQLGIWAIKGLRIVYSSIPMDLADALGILIILTIFIWLVHVARKTAWMIVLVGWALIIVRIVLIMIKRES